MFNKKKKHYHRNFFLPLPKTGTYTCLRKCNFLIDFLFIVFNVMYMLMPLYVLCSKIAIRKKIVFILKFPEILRGFPCSQSGILVENLLVLGVLSLSHRGTPHTIGVNG